MLIYLRVCLQSNLYTYEYMREILFRNPQKEFHISKTSVHFWILSPTISLTLYSLKALFNRLDIHRTNTNRVFIVMCILWDC